MICDTVSVMYCGNIVERGSRDTVLRSPAHPYTRALVRSEPSWLERAEELQVIAGQLPPLSDLPRGCRFHPRCEFMIDRCAMQVPALSEVKQQDICRRACGPKRYWSTMPTLLEVQKLVVDYPLQSRAARVARPGDGHARSVPSMRCQFRLSSGHALWPGGRERLRQEHARPGAVTTRGKRRREPCDSMASRWRACPAMPCWHSGGAPR